MSDTPPQAPATGYRKQEQEPARTEPTEPAPGIVRLELPVHIPGLRHVNCYVLEDENGLAIVDPGLPGPNTWTALQQRLGAAGMKVDDVHTIVVTHSHPDHFGQAGRVRAETGADIVSHRAFRTMFDLADAAGDDLDRTPPADEAEAKARTREARRLRKRPWDKSTPWGGRHPQPPRRFRVMFRLRRTTLKRWFARSEPTRRLDDADTITLGRRPWVAMHTPGHTQDHLCLYDPEGGVVLSGDHVLPTITPHISGIGADDALAQFFSSLDRMAEIPEVAHVLPAHGHPFVDLAGRAHAIREHHEERLDKLREATADLGPATVEELMQQLFRERSWGAMAESETFAHLEHLRRAGDARRHDDGPLARYSLA